MSESHDYFSPLRTLEVDATPMPVEDVMRAGTRRRRTQAAGTFVTAVALIAGVVVGGLQLAGPGRADSAPPAAPSSGYIPEDFTLGTDLPVASQQADVRGAEEAPSEGLMPLACGTGYVLSGTPLDRLAIQGTNAEYTGLRDLAVFGSADEARKAVADQVERFKACPSEGSGPRTVTTVAPAGLDDRSWVVQRATRYEGLVTGVEVWYLVQRGAASLVVTDYLDAMDQIERRDAEVQRIRAEAVEPILDRLCSVRTVC